VKWQNQGGSEGRDTLQPL